MGAIFFGVVPEGTSVGGPATSSTSLPPIVLIVVCASSPTVSPRRTDEVYRWLSDLPELDRHRRPWLFVVVHRGRGRRRGDRRCSLTRNFRLALTLVVVGLLTACSSLRARRSLVDVDAVPRRRRRGAGSLSANSVVWLAVDDGGAPLGRALPRAPGPAVGALDPGLAVVGGRARAPSARSARSWAPWASVGRSSAVASLVIGTPKATPTTRSVLGALDELGRLDRPSWRSPTTRRGARPASSAARRDGAPASVVVIGRDGADARLLSKVWRSTLYRDAGPSDRRHPLRPARAPRLHAPDGGQGRRAGQRRRHRRLRRAGRLRVARPARPRRATARPARRRRDHRRRRSTTRGRSLARLHDARLAHGKVGPGEPRASPTDGSVALARLLPRLGRRAARAVPCAIRSTCSCPPPRCVGDDRALAAAVRALGADGLAELLPLLQTAALSPAARRRHRRPTKRLKELREAGAARERRARSRSSPSCGGSRRAAWSWRPPRSSAST